MINEEHENILGKYSGIWRNEQIYWEKFEC